MSDWLPVLIQRHMASALPSVRRVAPVLQSPFFRGSAAYNLSAVLDSL